MKPREYYIGPRENYMKIGSLHHIPDDVFIFLPHVRVRKIRSLMIERLVSPKLNGVEQKWFV